MANPEHVEILKQGVDVWNKWREENRDVRPDLKEADLRKNAIKGTKLDNPDVNGTYLEKINFSNTNLTQAKLNDADLHLANMQNAYLSLTDFTGAIMINADLSKAMARGAVLERANLGGADIRGCDLLFTRLNYANVSDIVYNRKGKFRAVQLTGCFGSQRFKTFAQDQDFIEELRSSSNWGAFLFWIWWLFADCGRSFLRWAGWSLLFALSFAALFFFILGPESFKIAGPPADSFQTMVYYSVVTFTTLGFGDVTPRTIPAMWAVMAEVVLGYIMLGGLISILANKLARRS